jgi:hypothetical protein
MGRRWWAFGVAAVALVAMAGCGGGGGGEAGEPASTEPPVTVADPTTTVLSEEDAVLAAYQGYWDTWLAANDPPNPNYPGLADVRTGEVLAQTQSAIRNRAAVGQAIRLPEGALNRHSPVVVELSERTAEISDCAVDGAVLVGASDGFVLDDSVVTRHLLANLVLEGSLWRVSKVSTEAEWSGVDGCAA